MRNLTLLLGIDVSNTSLGGALPFWIGEWANIRTLRLSRCRFVSSLPLSITKLKFLTALDLAGNAFTGHLPIMRHFQELRDVYVQQNAFSGTIPTDFASSLMRLDVSRNELTGSIPAEIFLIRSLELFGASLNCLSEELPGSICGATGLTQVYLDGLGAGR